MQEHPTGLNNPTWTHFFLTCSLLGLALLPMGIGHVWEQGYFFSPLVSLAILYYLTQLCSQALPVWGFLIRVTQHLIWCFVGCYSLWMILTVFRICKQCPFIEVLGVYLLTLFLLGFGLLAWVVALGMLFSHSKH